MYGGTEEPLQRLLLSVQGAGGRPRFCFLRHLGGHFEYARGLASRTSYNIGAYIVTHTVLGGFLVSPCSNY